MNFQKSRCIYRSTGDVMTKELHLCIRRDYTFTFYGSDFRNRRFYFGLMTNEKNRCNDRVIDWHTNIHRSIDSKRDINTRSISSIWSYVIDSVLIHNYVIHDAWTEACTRTNLQEVVVKGDIGIVIEYGASVRILNGTGVIV